MPEANDQYRGTLYTGVTRETERLVTPKEQPRITPEQVGPPTEMTVLSKHEGGRYLLEFDRISTAEQVAAFLFVDGRVPKGATLERERDNFRRWHLRVWEEHAALLRNDPLGQMILAGPRRTAPTHIPYVPPDVERQILAGNHPSGKFEYGDVLLWVSRGSIWTEYDIFKFYPENIEYYRQFRGYEGRPEVLLKIAKDINAYMRWLVLKEGLPPSKAREKMRQLEDENFRMWIEAVATAYSSGSLLPHKPPSTLSIGAARATGQGPPNRMTGNKLGVAPKPSTKVAEGKQPKARVKERPKQPRGGISRSPATQRASIAGMIAEKIWEMVLNTVVNKKKFTVTFVDPITKRKKTVNIVPDFMPTGKRDANGKYLSADRPKDALVIADSKYTWDSAKKVVLDDQVRGMLVLAKQNNVPFVFLVKMGGDVSQAVKNFAQKLGVACKVVQDATGTIL